MKKLRIAFIDLEQTYGCGQAHAADDGRERSKPESGAVGSGRHGASDLLIDDVTLIRQGKARLE